MSFYIFLIAELAVLIFTATSIKIWMAVMASGRPKVAIALVFVRGVEFERDGVSSQSINMSRKGAGEWAGGVE